MEWGKNITGHLAVSILVTATILPMLSMAQQAAPHSSPPRQAPAPQQQVSRPPTMPAQQGRVGPKQQGHAGDWLRRYKDLAPDEQE
ncbi:MAG TPA: hypothetical protein VNS62_02850, partial [Candidatus Udaeobacter sp.]|nr:hypothetical protein [Candidatus Udaeobacter sp.]